MTSLPDARFSSAAKHLDARGWLCPQPIIQARHWLQQAQARQRLHVIVTDPHGPLDFEVFCHRSGHRLLVCKTVTDSDPCEWHVLIECADTQSD